MPDTTKSELNNVQEELKAALKARKKPLAKHTWMIWDRCVGRILDTRFEVTKSRLHFVSFDMEMEINSQDMEVVAPFSFDDDSHVKIGTNECNKIDRNGEDLMTRGESLKRPGRQRNQQKQFEQQGQGRKWSIYAEPSAEETGRERSG